MTLAPAPVNTDEQQPRLADVDFIGGDRALRDAMEAFGACTLIDEASAFGRIAGSTELLDAGFAANENPPRHIPYDRSGERTDDILFHPAWHQILGAAVEAGVAGGVWSDPRAGAHVGRAAKFIAIAQAEAGVCCPIAMTSSSVPALRLAEPDVARQWEALATSTTYDPSEAPAAAKAGGLIGMALTERSGGTDVRRSSTTAVADGDGRWRVTGEKWFVSAVQSDALFVLAQTGDGLSCILVPCRTESGARNGMRIDRLKDKLGNRSNPTAEVMFDDAVGHLVGEQGRGVRAIMAMIGGTRLDCILGSAGVMRLGTTEAINWALHRQVFGRRLVDQPAMTAVLADLALESEAAAWAGLRLARAVEDQANGDPHAAAFRRLALPTLKYWVCKRAPMHLGEALECLGGYGYIEESRLPRAYREAPLMSVWEGSGNVQALDVLRALQTDPECAEAVLSELMEVAGANRLLDATTAALKADLSGGAARIGEVRAREVTGSIARALQAVQLVKFAPAEVSDAFCQTRLGDMGGVFGSLPAGVHADAIVARAAAS